MTGVVHHSTGGPDAGLACDTRSSWRSPSCTDSSRLSHRRTCLPGSVRSAPPRWLMAAALLGLATVLLLTMHAVANAVSAGAPGWLNLVVLVLAWDALKVATLAARGHLQSHVDNYASRSARRASADHDRGWGRGLFDEDADHPRDVYSVETDLTTTTTPTRGGRTQVSAGRISPAGTCRQHARVSSVDGRAGASSTTSRECVLRQCIGCEVLGERPGGQSLTKGP